MRSSAHYKSCIAAIVNLTIPLDDLLTVTSQPHFTQNDRAWGLGAQNLGTWIGLRWARTLASISTVPGSANNRVPGLIQTLDLAPEQVHELVDFYIEKYG
jgi:hypothetical protein